jgi:DmsE family decaheme c-type cytochrome
MERTLKRTMCLIATIAAALLVSAVGASAADAPKKAELKAGFVGAETCLNCHTDQAGFKDTMHGRKVLSSKKLEQSCESCHGPGAEHSESGDISKIISPKKMDAAGVAETCFTCHKNKDLMMWKTGHHAQADVSCLQCHSVHEGDGRKSLKKAVVFDEKAQTETCLQCHKKQKADMRLASHHPIPEGKMACSSCHNPHGGIDGNLKADSTQELCSKCHADKAGPFANEHPPVTESCLNCHKPHGSANDKLLKQAMPYLCMNCHKFPHTTGTPAAVSISREEQRGNCIDCHKEIHGSDRKASFKD